MQTPALPLFSPIASALHGLRSWPRTSQERARRNAMLAATDCVQRRAERQDVDDYFASLSRPPQRGPAQAHVT